MMVLFKNYTNRTKFWRSSLGKAISAAEKKALMVVWRRLSGKYLLILGDPQQIKLTSTNRFTQKPLLLMENYPVIKNNESKSVQILYGSHNALPITPSSMECILLPHSLEWHENPGAILREIEIALRPDGELIIIGLNPFSLCGIRCLFSRHRMPWKQIFQNAVFVENWLKALGFKVKTKKKFLYGFPIKEKALLSKLEFLAWIAKFLCPFFGGIYILSAKKEVLGVTPLRIIWQKIPNLVAGHYPQPAKRTGICTK